jgi:hypothetical protein
VVAVSSVTNKYVWVRIGPPEKRCNWPLYYRYLLQCDGSGAAGHTGV